jgi:hypothetical protein
MRINRIIPLAALVVAAYSTGASAHSHLNCQAYAQSVVDYAKQNIGLGCGFSGPVWSTDFNFHFNWCNGVQMADLTREDRNRQAAMNQCKAEVKVKDDLNRNRQKYCLKYANQAQELRNQVNAACKGQDGGEWPKTVKEDVDFCMQKGGAFADLTNNNRLKQINTCQKAVVTKTFANSGFYSKAVRDYLPVDVCTKGVPAGQENLFNACGESVADMFCQQNGFQAASDFAKKNYNGGSNMDGDLPSTYWIGSKKVCTGDCTGFRYITCKGKL